MKTPKEQRYSVLEFNELFPTDDSCLDYVFNARFGKLEICPACAKESKFFRIKSKKVYSCQQCGHQISPLAETIFHKSSTSLKTWFYAIFLFGASKNGVAAKELERQLKVTYKTAWRMAQQIRKLYSSVDSGMMFGTVEVDETYIGGKAKGKRGRGAANKTAVVGIVQRGDEVRAYVVPDTKSRTVMPLIDKNVKKFTKVVTDEYAIYNRLSIKGFMHDWVNHSAGQYVDGDLHTNTIEGFWSQLKRSVNGTYHAVSPKYLQRYVDEFAFRYNRRQMKKPIFLDVLEHEAHRTFSPAVKQD